MLEVAPDATVTVIRSLAPGAGVDDDADSIVFDGWFPVTAVYGSEKHPFVSGGVLETVHAIVPV